MCPGYEIDNELLVARDSEYPYLISNIRVIKDDVAHRVFILEARQYWRTQQSEGRTRRRGRER